MLISAEIENGLSSGENCTTAVLSSVSVSAQLTFLFGVCFVCFSGADLFSNCTEECKALGHSDRCWMPSFVPSDSRQASDYRSNLHVPGMDAVPDTEVVVESQEQTGDRSFSTFGKEKSHHGTLERRELDIILPRTPYRANHLCEYIL